MRTRVVLFVLASLACTVAASSAESATRPDDHATHAASAPPTVAVQQVDLPLPAVHDEAAMVLVGGVLIALGAAVRRAA